MILALGPYLFLVGILYLSFDVQGVIMLYFGRILLGFSTGILSYVVCIS